jgi:N-acetylneuraminic acid mutarotase
MQARGLSVLAAIAIAMIAVFVFGVLAATSAIDLPGNWRTTLGLESATPNPPCRLGLYRKSPPAPPAGSGSWRFETQMPQTIAEGGAAAIGPVIYSAGGTPPGNLRRMLAFDTRSGKWSEPSQLPTGLNHVQATTYRGDVYLAGGYLDGLEATSNFWRYDPRTREWTRLPPMPLARGAAAAGVIGDKLYVADGAPQVFGVSNPPSPFKDLAVYDFATASWSSGPEAPFAVHHVNAAVLDGKLYLAGGRVDVEQSSDKFFRYDPATARWEVLPDLPLGKTSSAGIVAAGGRIVVIGGDDEVGWKDGDGWVTPTAWAFDPAADRWQRLPDLAIERHAVGAAVAGGRIYAIGGSYCPGLKPNGLVITQTVESLPVSRVGSSRFASRHQH